MLPTVSNSPTNHSSSNSTTPPSETTLADDDDAILNVRKINALNKKLHFDQKDDDGTQHHEHDYDDLRRQERTSGSVINTDYESSAEDFDSYTVSKYENAEYALLSYSRTNKLEKLKALLEAKSRGEVNLNLNYKGHQKQNFSWSALHLACYFGHFPVVEQILSKTLRIEVEINIQNNSGDTPLHKATLTNRVQIVQLLLANGANVFVKNCDGLLAKQLTSDKHILDMLEAAEQADKNRIRQNMFKAVDNGDLKKLQVYFNNYDSLKDAVTQPCYEVKPSGESLLPNNDEANAETSSLQPNDNNLASSDFVNQMTDERGNTLLHLAAMRGFKAICVYLLEQGFDPYRKNNLGQSCIELSSYQLRQLFMAVKPADNQLKRLSKERVTRFEGPLLKKVRILGWKQIYVVLENGVILLFNNHRDSMNKSRRGYKYLESATCEPDSNDVGVFTICFSDRSRATFLVSSDHINQYTTYISSPTQETGRSSGSQIELIRQKWINSISDHIVYSTEFIRKGLRLGDDDDESENYTDGCDVVNLNHLLPIDTIKSFVHEARAHYKILERHAESLCNLIQTISSSSTSGSFEAGQLDLQPESKAEVHQAALSTSASGRLLGLIRSSRQSRVNSIGGDAGEPTPSSIRRHQSLANRARNSSITSEFVQDNWPCVLFHFRLLMESTENTKTSMGQALALMEHQEQLRQNRIQDQQERCRVLEDSLHALARDHHELEKSLSMSQVYHSAVRSMSMSTDLNEYHDAFEDFDDEKTMTPTSLPSDEELDQKIQEVMNEGTTDGLRTGFGEPSFESHQQYFNGSQHRLSGCDRNDTEDEDEDDIRSNCSALTIETVTEQYLSAIDSQHQKVSNIKSTAMSGIQSRTRLPAPMVPRDQVSIWSILKNCIGKELSKITMPVVFNEPLSMCQRACEGIQYSSYLKLADLSDDPIERMEFICAFIVACLSVNCQRYIKPFNPLLYETYEYEHELEDGSHVKAVAQQVSHHPPITAACSESENFIYNGVVNPKIKFWGRSVEITHDGSYRVYLKRHKESYVFGAVPCSVHNIIVGKLWFEHHGPLDVKCAETKMQANLTFRQAGWFSNDLHRFDGFIVSGPDGKNSEKKKLRFVYGKWSDYIKSVDYSDYENYMRDNPQKLFKIPDNPDHGQLSNGIIQGLGSMSLAGGSPNSVNNNCITSDQQREAEKVGSVGKPKSLFKSGANKKTSSGNYIKSESTQSLDIPNSRTLWRLETQYLSEYYNFTLFTMKLNELTPELKRTIPKTDSRFRPDVRKLEEGDLDAAASEKNRLEEKQREVRNRDKRFKDPSPDFLWFEQSNEPSSGDRCYLYKGGYWENKCNQEKFPDIF